MQVINEIQWQLINPLDRDYYWLDILKPIILLEPIQAGKLGSQERKRKAKIIVEEALILAHDVCTSLDVRLVRIAREIGLTSKGNMKTCYIYFKLNENLKIL